MDPVRCPNCDRRLAVSENLIGHRVRCPHCRQKFLLTVPSSEPVQPTQPVELAQLKLPPEVESEPVREGSLSRPSQKIDQEELIDMTAMVDIVFFLLIFFLVTSMAGIQSSAKLPRPEAHDDENGAKKQQQVDDPQADPNAIIVKINKDDTVEIEGVPYRDFNDLTVRLRQLRNVGGSDTSVLVLGHAEASHGAAVAVLDTGYEVGIDRLRLAVMKDEAE